MKISRLSSLLWVVCMAFIASTCWYSICPAGAKFADPEQMRKYKEHLKQQQQKVARAKGKEAVAPAPSAPPAVPPAAEPSAPPAPAPSAPSVEETAEDIPALTWTCPNCSTTFNNLGKVPDICPQCNVPTPPPLPPFTGTETKEETKEEKEKPVVSKPPTSAEKTAFTTGTPPLSGKEAEEKSSQINITAEQLNQVLDAVAELKSKEDLAIVQYDPSEHGKKEAATGVAKGGQQAPYGPPTKPQAQIAAVIGSAVRALQQEKNKNIPKQITPETQLSMEALQTIAKKILEIQKTQTTIVPYTPPPSGKKEKSKKAEADVKKAQQANKKELDKQLAIAQKVKPSTFSNVSEDAVKAANAALNAIDSQKLLTSSGLTEKQQQSYQTQLETIKANIEKLDAAKAAIDTLNEALESFQKESSLKTLQGTAQTQYQKIFAQGSLAKPSGGLLGAAQAKAQAARPMTKQYTDKLADIQKNKKLQTNINNYLDAVKQAAALKTPPQQEKEEEEEGSVQQPLFDVPESSQLPEERRKKSVSETSTKFVDAPLPETQLPEIRQKEEEKQTFSDIQDAPADLQEAIDMLKEGSKITDERVKNVISEILRRNQQDQQASIDYLATKTLIPVSTIKQKIKEMGQEAQQKEKKVKQQAESSSTAARSPSITTEGTKKPEGAGDAVTKARAELKKLLPDISSEIDNLKPQSEDTDIDSIITSIDDLKNDTKEKQALNYLSTITQKKLADLEKQLQDLRTALK